MKAGLTISTCAHLAVFGLGLLMMWGVISFAKPLPPLIDAVAVDTISEDELTHMMAGSKTAKKADVPKPIVDKVGEPSPIKDPSPKVSDKPEIKATADEPPTPPDPKPPEPPKQATQESVPPKPDPIAEALKQDEAKKQEEVKKQEEAKKREEAKKKEEVKKKLEAKKREQEKFNTSSIESRLALLDKRAPQRNATTGLTLNQNATLGTQTGTSMNKMSATEMDALISRLTECWDVPVGMRDARDLVVTVHILFKRDGSLAAEPVVVNHSALPVFQVAAESALRAVRKCAPYNFLPPARYEYWNDVIVDFDPRQMFGG
jgi:hypothetical protein